MGLVIVLLTARLWGGLDWIADPVGWVLVLLGARRLPVEAAQRSLLLGRAAAALVVSVVLFVPAVSDRVLSSDPTLWWALSLPQLLFCTLLAWRLSQRATLAGDERSGRWLRTAAVLVGLGLVLPPIVFGGGLAALESAVYAIASLALVVLVVLLFRYTSRPWALPEG